MRTHTCGELTKANLNQEVTLCGWVNHRRDFGNLIFITIRDRYGITQIQSDLTKNPEVHKIMETLKSEYVIKIIGTVQLRPENAINPKISTGEIEIHLKSIEILNECKPLPFELDQDLNINEDLRLKYRYLDLRRERLKNNIISRYQISKLTRQYFDSLNFLEIETPILLKGTPEGSREYLVPSRLYPSKFYVLPQSPQQLKQLLMVSGFDRYFQLARCFRDEDQRGDRQPEFTQIDLEMSFIDAPDIMRIIENFLITLTKNLLPNKQIKSTPFPLLSYQQAMEEYGSDKPDNRFDLKIQDVTKIFNSTTFQVFQSVITSNGAIKALKIDNGAKFTRKEIDELIDQSKQNGLKGLSHVSLTPEGIKSSISKFLTESETQALINATNAQTGDLILLAADQALTACKALGQTRLTCADKLNLRDPNVFSYLWVYDFPLFEWNPDENRYESVHHPFTMPMEEDLKHLNTDPSKVRGKHYDIILNGYELGGGSIRIHKPSIQSQVFDILGISKEDANRRFGHLLTAFEYGAPPHGGIALGLDRIVMLFNNEPNIREIIPFPKDQQARDLMTGSPSEMPEAQIQEANIQILTKPEAN